MGREQSAFGDEIKSSVQYFLLVTQIAIHLVKAGGQNDRSVVIKPTKTRIITASKNIANNDDSPTQKISPKSNKINKNKSCCMTRLFLSFFGKSRSKLPITERLWKRLKPKSNSILRFALKLLRLVDTMNNVVEIRR